MGTSTEAQKRAVREYQRRQDNIMIRPTKEEGARIRAAAADAGLSVQRYILGVLREKLGEPQEDHASDVRRTE